MCLEARAVPGPAWVQFNDALALELGWEPTLKSATGLAWLSGVEMLEEGAAGAGLRRGHQFGPVLATHLGMAAPCCSGNSSTRQDSVGTWPSGESGRTPFPRRGDGKAALDPALREYP